MANWNAFGNFIELIWSNKFGLALYFRLASRSSMDECKRKDMCMSMDTSMRRCMQRCKELHKMLELQQLVRQRLEWQLHGWLFANWMMLQLVKFHPMQLRRTWPERRKSIKEFQFILDTHFRWVFFGFILFHFFENLFFQLKLGANFDLI